VALLEGRLDLRSKGMACFAALDRLLVAAFFAVDDDSGVWFFIGLGGRHAVFAFESEGSGVGFVDLGDRSPAFCFTGEDSGVFLVLGLPALLENTASPLEDSSDFVSAIVVDFAPTNLYESVSVALTLKMVEYTRVTVCGKRGFAQS